VVTFHQETMESVVGQLVWLENGERKTPAFGLITVTVNGRVTESPISLDGAFFLEQVPTGVYMATVSYRGDQCAMPLTVLSHNGTILNVGTLTCVISR
jgi:outer membrane usher protein FimD/PapC